MYEPKIAQITQASCQTLISNLEYFELYPIHNDFDYLVQDNTKKVYLAHASTGSDTIAASNVTNFQIKDLNGFYYMLGAAGMRQTAISTTDATNPVMPRFNTAKQPLEHIQGTAMFKSPMTTSSNEYVYQATYNNSI